MVEQGDAPAFAVTGRAREAELLRSVAHDALTSRGRCVVIEGEPGIGKTTIVNLLADVCRGHGARTMTGQAEDLDSRLPFAAVASCLGLRGATGDPEVAEVIGLVRGDRGQR